MTTLAKQTMYQQIEQHGNDLNAIFNTGIDPVKLCKSLRRLELKANKIATDWCNGVIDSENIDSHTEPILKLFAFTTLSLIFNAYPLASPLKTTGYLLPNSFATAFKLYTDWGGYGIICPDFTPNS